MFRLVGIVKKSTSLVLAMLFTVTLFGFMVRPKAAAAPTGLPSGFSATTLINHSMIAPTSVRVAPDGRIFVVDLLGTIKIFSTATNGFLTQNFGSVTVNASGDKGLLGAAFDPDFTNNPYLYIHYVGADDKVRVGRFNASGNVGTGFSELYVAPIASGFQHAGGGITVGLDGKVYFGIGDSGTPTNSQQLTVNHGKIHRINRDGTVPVNPFAGQVGVPATIYAYGVRNPFRLTTDKLTGDIYIGDVGFNTWEEINLLSAGKNYGWATQEGPCTSTCAFENPVYWYGHQFGTNNTNDASIVAGPVYRGTKYPASYQGKMFVSDYVQGFIRTISPTTASSSFNTFSTANGTVIDMDIGPDGNMYFITINSPTLYRLDYNGASVNQAPEAVAGANTLQGPAPLTTAFTSAGSRDPEGQPLSYVWNFGDGTTSTQANPTKTYTSVGQYTVSLTVSDGVNSTPATPLTVRVGSQPVVTISTPLTTTKYNAGQTVNYSATAVDASGTPLPNSSLTTTVRLYHSDHSHPFVGPFVGGTGSITAPVDGELSPDVWLRITVEATHGNGVTGSSYVDIYPNLSQMTVTTSPAGLNGILDGSNHVIPPTVQGVIGMNRQIAAPSPQIFQGQQYVFSHWSDGGAQNHTLQFPATTTTYTAFYVPATTGTTFVNQISNPSFENGTSLLPTDWFFSRWGTNDAAFSTVADARTGVRSAKMQATTLVNGEGRLYHKAVPVTENTSHNVQYFYKSTVQMKAVADVTLNDNSHKYIWLGISQPSTGWNEQNWTFTTPANAKNVVVSLYLTAVGSVQIDDFTLLAPTTTVVPPTTTAPAVTFTATPTTIITGQSTTLNWSVTGTAPSCIASGGWDGARTATGSQAVSPGSTINYVLTCSNAAGTDAKTVTVTVNPVVVVPPTGTGNIVPNPSIEDHTPADLPAEWRSSKWGTNTATFTHAHGSAYLGDHSLKAEVTARTSGEASWVFTPQNVTPNTLYTFSQYVKSSGSTKVLVDITLTSGAHQYIWLGTLPTTATYAEFKKTFTTPATAAKVTVGTYMTGVGYFELDNVSLVPPTTVVVLPTVTVPVVTLSALATTITAGQSTTLNWSVTGTTPTCTASGAWNGTQTATGSLLVKPAATSSYTLTCANSAGTDAKTVTVAVNPVVVVPPSITNLIANPTLFDIPVEAAEPLGWYKGSWGNNTATFTKQAVGRTDGASLQVNVTNYVDGDAKWYFEPVTITGGLTHMYTHWYTGSVESELVVEYTLTGGTKSYVWLGFVPAAAIWTELSKTIIAPVDATKMTMFHVLKNAGQLQLDDFSISAL